MPTQAIDFNNITNVVFNGADQDEVVINGSTIWEFPAITGTLFKQIPNGGSWPFAAKGALACTDTYTVVGNQVNVFIYNTITGALLHTLSDNDLTGNYYFGDSVACTDTYTVVGAPLYNSRGGKICVYNTSTGSLLHTMIGTIPLSKEGDSVACTDTYTLAGGDGWRSAGTVQVYSTANGSLLHTLSNPNAFGAAEGDYFGVDLACTDTYAVVGASSRGSRTPEEPGHVYVYNIATGALLYTLDHPTPSLTPGYDSDSFGYSVACTDLYLVVGGGDDDKVSILDITNGNLLHTIDNPNYYDGFYPDRFGSSIDCTDACTIVGAPSEGFADGRNNRHSGVAYIFNTKTGALIKTVVNPNAHPTDRDRDYFGASVAISANSAAVGSTDQTDQDYSYYGMLYLYT